MLKAFSYFTPHGYFLESELDDATPGPLKQEPS